MSGISTGIRVCIKLCCNPWLAAAVVTSTVSPVPYLLALIGIPEPKAGAIALMTGFIAGFIFLVINIAFLVRSRQRLALHDIVVHSMVVAKEQQLKREYVQSVEIGSV